MQLPEYEIIRDVDEAFTHIRVKCPSLFKYSHDGTICVGVYETKPKSDGMHCVSSFGSPVPINVFARPESLSEVVETVTRALITHYALEQL